MKYVSKVKDGKLENRTTAATLAKSLIFFEGKYVDISVKEYKDARSGSQNRYYWKVVIPAITKIMRQRYPHDEITQDDAHTAAKFFGGVYKTRYDLATGKKTKTIGSTTELETDKFQDYIEQIRAFAASEGVDIPDPMQ